MHVCPEELIRRRVNVLVVGCGGNGSAIAGGLPYLHQALVAAGHPGGLHVTLMDGDTVSATNCIRQPFSISEIGLHKSVVLANRLNAFWGLDWTGVPTFLTKTDSLGSSDILIGAVDNRATRCLLAEKTAQSRLFYWLDLGNHADGGQFVLGQPLNQRNRRKADRLRTVAELYPEITDGSLDAGDGPSCSAVEALDRQEPFVNQTLAYSALGLLARLFRHGQVAYQGAFYSQRSGRSAGLTPGTRRAQPKKMKRVLPADIPAHPSLLNSQTPMHRLPRQSTQMDDTQDRSHASKPHVGHCRTSQKNSAGALPTHEPAEFQTLRGIIPHDEEARYFSLYE